MYVYNAAWLALGLVLSAVFAAAAVIALRRRGIRPAIFLAGLAMLPMAGYLTGTLRLLGVIVDQVTGYLVGFAFNPLVWLGVVLAGIGVLLMATASMMKRRGIAAPAERRKPDSDGGAAERTEPLPDSDGMDDIEAILRKHGIS